MKKRTFLQGLFSALVYLGVGGGVSAAASKPFDVGFDPRRHYGRIVILAQDWLDMSYEVRQRIIEVMTIDARKSLPAGTEFTIQVNPAPEIYRDRIEFETVLTADEQIVSWMYPPKPGWNFIGNDSMRKRVIA